MTEPLRAVTLGGPQAEPAAQPQQQPRLPTLAERREAVRQLAREWLEAHDEGFRQYALEQHARTAKEAAYERARELRPQLVDAVKAAHFSDTSPRVIVFGDVVVLVAPRHLKEEERVQRLESEP